MKDGPRYLTLRDYLQVVRANRLLIVAVTLALAGGAYAFSTGQKPTYVAEASLSLSDATRDSDLLGVASSFLETSEVRASLAAGELTRIPTARRVKRELHSKRPLKKIKGAISAAVQGRSNLVVIEARWGSSRFAARLANGYAVEGIRVLTKQERGRYTRAARTLRRRFKELKKETKDRYSRAVYIERISRLEALASFARPVRIVRRASVPNSPASPKPGRNAILGGVLGLVLGLIAAFLRDALDRRVRAPAEIEREFELPVLGQVREEALGRGPVPCEGRDALSHADLEAFRILRTSLELLDTDRPRRVVVVTSPLPEEGKSTVTVALAAAAASAGRRTLILESDLRRPTLARRLGIAAEPGLSNVLTGHGKFEDVVQTIALTPPQAVNGDAAGSLDDGAALTVDCLTAGTPTPRPAETLRLPAMEDLLARTTAGYDLVVVDTCPLLPVADTLALFPHADLTLLCVRSSSATREEIDATKTLLERVPANVAGIVVTGLRARDAAAYGYYPYAYSYDQR